MRFKITFTLLIVSCLGTRADDQNPTPPTAEAPVVIETGVLPRISLSEFGNPACTKEALDKAVHNGLKFTDLPSIGSGLAKVGDHEFIGLTDRGPNGVVETAGGSRRTFPLPQFCPTIVRFKLAASELRITEVIPMRDRDGRLISGVSNGEGEERLYDSPDSGAPLPFDPNGVDPEAIRVFPNGTFLVSEEYSPSILVVSARGQVLMRYTPKSKPLTNANYPVKAILPDSFTQRRVNRGFENLALSSDGRLAWAILQAPMGEETDKRFHDSRVMRILKLDVSRPLEAKVVGEYLVLASPVKDYALERDQPRLGWSDAEWIGPDRLLAIERGKGEVRLLALDLSLATDVLKHKDEAGLTFENTSTDLAALGIRTAQIYEVLSTRKTTSIESDKIEGVTLLGPDVVALCNDNDFGIGDNVNGEPSKVWVVRVPALRKIIP